LLSATLRSAADPSAETARLARAWSRGDADALAGLDRTGLLADPELREALLVKRNRAWLGVLEPMLRRGERPLVAVGALHVVGQDGLAAQLAGDGYKIARIQ
jgi:hypothetical protein